MPRLFLAIPLAPEVIAGLERVQECLRRQLAPVRWNTPETLHLTLRFFGELPEETLEPIRAVMLSVSTPKAPFSLRLCELGAFPSVARPRVLWAGFAASDSLLALQRDLVQGLARIGLPPEDRPFHPHLTLGRARSPLHPCGDALARCRPLLPETVAVARLILYESRLRPAGPLHLPRCEQPLAGGETPNAHTNP